MSSAGELHLPGPVSSATAAHSKALVAVEWEEISATSEIFNRTIDVKIYFEAQKLT